MSNFSDFARPGDRIDLEPVSTRLTNEEEKKIYVTKIFDIDDLEDTVEAFMPMEQTKLQLLPVGAEYEASIYCKKGIYACKLRVNNRYKQNALFVVVFDVLTDLKKQQRRQYFRLDCIIGMNTNQLSEEESEEYMKAKRTGFLPNPEGKSVIVDISGGGLRFITSEHYDVGSNIHCRFLITVNDTPQVFNCILNVIATKPVANNPKNREFRGAFVEMSNVEREQLIKFIFEEQRKQFHKN